MDWIFHFDGDVMAIDFSKFYFLNSESKRGTIEVDSDIDDLDSFGVLSGQQMIGKLSFYVHKGKRFADLIDTTFLGLHLVSNNFVQVLEENEFVGWRTYPVTVKDKQGGSITGYSGLVVTGKGGPMEKRRSKTFLKPPSARGGKPVEIWRGLYFDPLRWDHSDVFLIEKTLFIIVTEKVRERLLAANLSNLSFKPLIDIEQYVL